MKKSKIYREHSKYTQLFLMHSKQIERNIDIKQLKS